MRAILKVFIEFVTILLLFYILVFGHETCGILAPQPGIKLAPSALEGEVLTTGPPSFQRSNKIITIFLAVFFKLGLYLFIF